MLEKVHVHTNVLKAEVTRWTFFRVKLVFECDFEIYRSLGPWDPWTLNLDIWYLVFFKEWIFFSYSESQAKKIWGPSIKRISQGSGLEPNPREEFWILSLPKVLQLQDHELDNYWNILLRPCLSGNSKGTLSQVLNAFTFGQARTN